MNRSHRALGSVVVVAMPCLFALGYATVAAGDDRASAAALLSTLEQDNAHAILTADAVKQAKVALERGTRMRDANDEARARLAEGVALRWAEVARDLVRAAEAEETANETRLAANDAGARAERERARLEEAIARQGRLHAELDGLRDKHTPERTAAVGASIDGGVGPKSPKTTPGPSNASRNAVDAGRSPGAGSGPEAGVMP